MWPFKTRWQAKQHAAKPARFYGDGGTIHRTGFVDVETDAMGTVVAVWFRCQPLPFKQTFVAPARATEMRHMMTRYDSTLTGVHIQDKEQA